MALGVAEMRHLKRDRDSEEGGVPKCGLCKKTIRIQLSVSTLLAAAHRGLASTIEPQ